MEFVGRPLAIAVFFVLVAHLWSFPLQHIMAYPFVFLFFGAIMCSAWFGGFIAGMLAAALSSLLVDYFFIPPLYSFVVGKEFRSFETAFVICSIAITGVSAGRRRSEAAIRSARDELERRVEERTAELQRNNSELLLAQERLARLSRNLSMAEMAASIAHELNQPLTALLSDANACRRWLQSGPANIDRAASAAERIVRDTVRASEVVARVRALFSRSEYLRVDADLNELVRDLVRLLRDEANRRNVSIRLQLSQSIPPLKIDPIQIQQVLLNLAINGMDAMAHIESGRVLAISTEMLSDREILVSVTDQGSGLSEEVKARIFDPFFTTKQEGTGMGLAICRSIIEEHEGRIWAESLNSATAIHFILRTTS